MNLTEEVEVSLSKDGAGPPEIPMIWIYCLFFASGIPAIIYQVVWQRALFSLFGINIESVTIVVSAFMLGLGLGSLAGGALSKKRKLPPVALFAVAEIGTALFALASLRMFHVLANVTLSSPLWLAGTISFLLVVIPTILMGSTLPLLTEHLVRRAQGVGGSVGALYFANTLGSGAACILVIRPLMNSLGQAGAVRCAALINGLIGLSALGYSFFNEPKGREADIPTVRHSSHPDDVLLPFKLALFCAAGFGFIALSYEIIWYRLLAFALADTAPTFASLLGSYLIGIALGSRFGERYVDSHSVTQTIRVLPIAILGSGVIAFWVSPLSALALKFIWPESATGGVLASLIFLFLICHGAILFGALFPLITHVAVGPKHAGAHVSYLYASNIAGSTAGILLVGLVLMNRFSLFQVALLLLGLAVVCALVVFLSSTKPSRTWSLVFSTACLAAVFVAPASRPVFTTIYDRLLFKRLYPTVHFSETVENRSGTIGITPDDILFGGGVYDGHFNTDLLNDNNIIVRPFALSAFHARPAHVLMIGLGSGSWAQVIANCPQLDQLTAIDINPGYIEPISKHPATASLLHNPKVSIVIDDGRRWLLRHPERTFDAIVMNTSFYWRNHSSNLLSADFLQIVRSHLRPKGVFFYNTTRSEDVVATGVSVFPYSLRVFNCIALSDYPLVFDRVRWKSALLSYSIDGKRVVNPHDPGQMNRLEQIVNVPEAAPEGEWMSIETNDQMRHRLIYQKHLIITDDNMGVEWQ